MTGKFAPRPVSTRYPGGIRVDHDQSGAITVYRSGRTYPAGTVGHYVSSRHPSVS